jgi:hypothetical protein
MRWSTTGRHKFRQQDLNGAGPGNRGLERQRTENGLPYRSPARKAFRNAISGILVLRRGRQYASGLIAVQVLCQDFSAFEYFVDIRKTGYPSPA